MSLRRHVYRLPSQAKCGDNIVWIGEDILNDAIQRFSHARTCRRHVGHVPGPMEARKRATKRCMVGLAQVGGGMGVDPALLSGIKQPLEPNWSWQRPKLPTSSIEKGMEEEIVYL